MFSNLQRRIENAGFGHFVRPFFPLFKVQKITLTTASSCPNRDPLTGRVGCTYCNNQAFSPAFAAKELSVEEQLARGIDFFNHKYPRMHYLAYFQSYTATFGSPSRLMKQYEEALAYPGVEGLVLATRPDMMPNVLLDFLEEKARVHFVLIEYGIESTLDRTLATVNRGHSFATAANTIYRTSQRGILVGAHLILGLPGESRDEMLAHADKLSELPIDILKLHQLQIVRDTPMAEQFAANPGDFSLFSPEEYAELCLDFLMRLREDIALDRFLSQSPPELLIAPRWDIKNYAFNAILLRSLARWKRIGV